MTQSSSILFLCTANYYRSRFAELYFNHLATEAGLEVRADSAGLEMARWRSFNSGELSVYSVKELERLGVQVPKPYREPKQFEMNMLRCFSRCIALSESEHRPIALEHFPDAVDRFEYWTVEDIEFESAESALGRIQKNVQGLIDALKA